MKAFSTAFTRGLPHGIVAAVHLPDPTDDIAESVLNGLHEDERAHAADLNGKRRVEWIGGRVAARVAAQVLGFDLPPVLPDNFGAPQAPKALSISIAHKGSLAIALVARRAHGCIGVDLELLGRDRREIASKVLNELEASEVAALRDDRQWTSILLRFAIKEAIYKAIAPRLRRYVGFDEAQITSLSNGSADVKLTLKGGNEPTHIEARYDWIPDGLLATARVRWE